MADVEPENSPELPPGVTLPEGATYLPLADPCPWGNFPPTLDLSIVLAWGEMTDPAPNKTANVKPRDSAAYSYSYATLGELLKHARPVLAKYGLAVLQLPVTAQGNSVTIRTRLLHWTGADLVTEPLVFSASGGPQAVAGVISYGRRYQLSALLNIHTGEDTDAQEAPAAHERPQAQRRTNTASGPPKRSQADPGPSGGDVAAAHAPDPIARPKSPPETPLAALAQHYNLPSAKPWIDAVNTYRNAGEPIPKQPADVELSVVAELNNLYAELAETAPMDMAPWLPETEGAEA